VSTPERKCIGAHVLFVPHDGKVIYVTNRVDGAIVALDPNTLAEVRRFGISGGPDDLDFPPDGKIWVTRRWANSVSIVDPLTATFETLETGRSPHGIWLNTHDASAATVPTPAVAR
jgi:DNA-binding beta-propeller fold protein YncE